MARSCAICGKVSMGGFNPQSSGSNRVRAHRRMQPNLQPLVIDRNGSPVKRARLHALPTDDAQGLEVGRSPDDPSGDRLALGGVEPDRERPVVHELHRHLGPEATRLDPDVVLAERRPRTAGRGARPARAPPRR